MVENGRPVHQSRIEITLRPDDDREAEELEDTVSQVHPINATITHGK